MSNLEQIRYEPCFPEIQGSVVNWVTSKSIRCIERLPQIFWRNGQPWSEVNLWALEMGRNKNIKLKTIQTIFEHLHKYANWLEQEKIDWRHFPKQMSERVIVRFRGYLIDLRDRGGLSPSTTSARMRAVIRFYRYADCHSLIGQEGQLWKDKIVSIKYFDTRGFQRTLQRITSDISIPNRRRVGIRLEDGLLPISAEHMTTLLQFAQKNMSQEMYLILLVAFFTGARLSTITSLRSYSLEHAMRDHLAPDMWVIPVGPGTGISTKFDVVGELFIPNFLMESLQTYAYSRKHLDRVIRAKQENKSYLFLTRQFRPYTPNTVDRQMVGLRKKGLLAGLKFLKGYRFHQARATFCTWLLTICLEVASVKASIEFTKRIMLHKHESTTFKYVLFIEHSKAKIEISNEFTKLFFGMKNKLIE